MPKGEIPSATTERNLPNKVVSFATRHPRGAAAVGIVGGVSLLGAEVYRRRMNNLFAADRLTPDSNELKQFKTAPSLAPALLEEHLGLRFEKRPVKVEYTSENKRIHEKIDPVDAYSTGYNFEKNAVALYKRRYNIYFTEPGANLMIDLHESAHGFLHQFNPELAELEERYNNAFTEGISLSDKDIEKYVVSRAFNEGIAEVMRFTTVFKHHAKHRDDKEKAGAILGMIAANVNRNTVTILENSEGKPSFQFTPFLENDREKLMQAKELYSQALMFKNKNFFADRKQRQSQVLLRQQANGLLLDRNYRIGGYFASIAKDELEKAGMDLPDAVITLMHNPPDTIDDLLDPRRYIQEKVFAQEE